MITDREAGEMLYNNPPLRNIDIMESVKRLKKERLTLRQIAVVVGVSRSLIKKYSACLCRANRGNIGTPLPISAPSKWGESGTKNDKIAISEKGKKSNKSLVFNFSGTIGGCDTLKGVTKHRGRGWKAQIRTGEKVKHLGVFATVSEAENAYQKFKNKMP